MGDHRAIKGWLLLLAVLLVLALAYVGHDRWRHSQLAKALHDPDPVVRMDAVRKAGKSGHEYLLIEALRDDDPDIRYVAASSLGGEGSEEKVHALLELFKDDHAYVREEALHVLKLLPPSTRPFLYKAVEDDDPQIRAATAYALVYVQPQRVMGMEFPPPPRPAKDKQVVVALMTRLLKDDNVEVRKAASFCLFSYHLETEEALRVRSALKEVPEEKDQDARDLTDRLKREAERRSR
jgi:HEAT repeat protein